MIKSGILKGRNAVQFVNGAISDFCQGNFAASAFSASKGMTVAVVWMHTEVAWDVNNAQKVVAMGTANDNDGANGFYLGSGNIGGTPSGRSYQTGWCASSACSHIFSNSNLVAPTSFSLTISAMDAGGLKTYHDGAYSSSASGRAGLDPRIVCLGASMQAQPGCTASTIFSANMMIARVLIWQRKLTEAEVEQTKVFINSQYRLVGLARSAINCNLLSDESRVWCDFWSFPPELNRGLFFHLSADDYHGTGVRPFSGSLATGSTWKNLRDSEFASGKGYSPNLSHMTCTGSGILYNVVNDPTDPMYLNGRGYISLSGTSYCSNVLPGTQDNEQAYFDNSASTASTEFSSRSIIFLSKTNGFSNALPYFAVGPWGGTAPEASQRGVLFEKGCGTWGTCTFAYRQATNIIGSCSCGSGTSGTDSGLMTVSSTSFSLQAVRITKDSSKITVDDSTVTDAHTAPNQAWWTKAIGMNTKPMGNSFSAPAHQHEFAFVMMYDVALSDPEFELLKLWIASEYGMKDLDVNCEIVSPRYREICSEVLLSS